jgi:hypothetical protein
MNALAEISRIDNPVQEETEATETTVETQVMASDSVPAAHLIDLPNGIQVYRKKIAGREYFQFLKMSKDGAEEGIKYVMMQMFINIATGRPLTIEEIEDEEGIGFEGVARLADEVVKVFPSAQAKLR